MQSTISHPHTGASVPARFPNFRNLPPELRQCVWELALPGPRLIEVYNRPVGGGEEPGQFDAWRWRATKCKCKRRCNHPLTIRQTCREARLIALKHGTYARCFGTWVNWAIDTIYIGERVGHLHNTGFLKDVEKGGGLEKLRYLAIEDGIIDEMKYMHGGDRMAFKRCSVPGMLVQLRALKTITVVGKAMWRDGNELFDDIDFVREWLWAGPQVEHGSVTEEETEEDSDEELPPNIERVWYSLSPDENRAAARAGLSRRNRHEYQQSSDGSDTSDEDLESQNSDDEDPWECGGGLAEDGAWGFKPYTSDRNERRFGYNRECGLALVPFKNIEGDKIIWGGEFESGADVKSRLRRQFRELKEDPSPQFEADDDPDSENFEDYTAWKPPRIKLALFRKTARSCCKKDWTGLERDYMEYEEACHAKLEPEAYRRRDKSKDYPVSPDQGSWLLPVS